MDDTTTEARPAARPAPTRVIRRPLLRTLERDEKSRAIQRLQQLDRPEKERLALITHDMRTPLSVITGSARDLRDKWHELPETERLEMLDAILRNGETLARLVTEDLQLAVIDTGELSYEITPFDLAAQIDQIVDDLARAVGARIELHIDRPLPLVQADRQRNAQILTNLLSNAVKFSPAGTVVEVAASRRGPMVHVAVSDDGPGISRSDSRKLFRKFSRLGSLDVEGTGLGLYLSKCMVEAQGGQISVESRDGGGATFTYTLPVAAGPAEARR
jgi:signal transduction histidine kinase